MTADSRTARIPAVIPVLPPAHVLAWSETLLDTTPLRPAIALWLPAGDTVVLGLAQTADKEVDAGAMRRDGVALVRRQSGGGAVFLYGGVLCWEAWATPEQTAASIRQAYAVLSEPIVKALALFGIEAFSAGICDVSTRDDASGEIRKMAGTAQLRRKNAVLVHGSLLVSADVGRLGAYLKIPDDQPEYRARRSHREFCVTVAEKMAAAEAAPAGSDQLLQTVANAVHRAATDMEWETLSPPGRLSGAAARLRDNKYSSEAWNWHRSRDGFS